MLFKTISKVIPGTTEVSAKSRYGRLSKSVPAGFRLREDNHAITWDKTEGFTDWRELAEWAKSGQDIRHRGSSSQDFSKIRVDPVNGEIAICVLGDTHWGSWGADYKLIESITDELISIDGLYTILVGDLEQQAIKMRNVLEVCDNILPPEMQARFTESWLDEIGPKVLAACWDNHAVMRQEAATGQSSYKKAVSEKCVYFNGIGHLDVTVGEETYKIALSHFFRGRSVHNPCYGQRLYMQTVGQDREIAIAGDSHEPGILEYANGQTRRLCVNCGTTQTNSGYAKRFFSLYSLPVFPIVVLSANRHSWRVFWNLQDYVDYRNATNTQ